MSIFENEDPSDSDSAGGSKTTALLIGAAVAVGVGVAIYVSMSEEPPPPPAPSVVETKPEPPPPAPERNRPPADIRSKPRTGTLRIGVDVPGAELFIDDEPRGQLPQVIEEMDARLYRIRVSSEGYEDYVSSVTVAAGRDTELDVALSRTPPSLVIASDVAGATVFVDRNYVGTTPLTIPKLTPGQHQLTVSADGYDVYAETIVVEHGRKELNVRFKNAVVSESTPVIHKHRMGSCDGRLVADGAGLTYDTTHKDRFTVPYAELEEFEVDYIEKNLKVKPRGQRNYNFTDPSGESDPLYVFHQKVTAFRERIGR